MSAEIVRWRGGPGSGKTHKLVEFVREEINRGRSPNELAIMSFARSQTADLRVRIGDASRTRKYEIRTIHGTVLSACIRAGLVDLKDRRIITLGEPRHAKYYRSFCEVHDLKFASNVRVDDMEEGQYATRDLLPGNTLFAMSTYLKSTMRGYDEWKTAQADLDLAFPAYRYNVPDLMRAWDEYKLANHLLEHEDYIHIALDENLPPPAPVLITDEYQDVSPSQHAVVRRWVQHPATERVYIAGDEHQSIYGFRGCDPSLLLSHHAEDRGSGVGNPRPVSRRCPGNVIAAAEAVLGHQANAAPCEGKEGLIATISPRTIDDLARQVEEGVIRAGRTEHRGADVYILCRFGHYVQDLSKGLFKAGIPHTSIREGRITRWESIRLGRDSKHLDPDTVDVWPLVCAVRKIGIMGDFVTLLPPETEALMKALVPEDGRSAALTALKAKYKRTKVLVAGDVFQHAPLRESGTGILGETNIRDDARTAIATCLRREKQRGFTIRPDQVRIDTIHSAKGLETPVVFLHTGYIKGRLAGLQDASRVAEERRVYYVGLARTSDVLLFLDAFKGDGVTTPLLQGVM